MTDRTSHYASNKLGAPFFLIEDSTSIKPYAVSFEWDCSKEKILWAQRMFLILPNFVRLTEHGTIEIRGRAKAAVDVRLLKDLCLYWESKQCSKSLWNWSSEEIKNLLRVLMIRTTLGNDQHVLYTFNKLNMYSNIINCSHNAYLDGRLTDGFGLSIDSSFKKSAMTPLLKNSEISFGDWQIGGTLGSIPPAINALLLSHAIDMIESENVLVAQCYFKAWHIAPISPSCMFNKVHSNGQVKDAIERFHTGSKSANCRLLAEQLKDAGLSHIKKLPWSSAGELASFCQEIETACMIIILSLTGHRIGELLSVSSSDYTQKNGELFFKEEIEKTLDGISIPRHFHSLSARAANILWGLSYINPEKNRLPLFHRGYSYTAVNLVLRNGDTKSWLASDSYLKEGTLRAWINNYYIKHITTFHHDIAKAHSRITPHQFRHSWAEFALRRFDHNVAANIREHFLHKSDSATRRYLNGKLKDSIRYAIQHQYLDEVIHSISVNPALNEFKGPAFNRISTEVSKIKTIHPFEFDEYVSEISDNIKNITAFEWGFCVFFKYSEHDAKCRDRITGLADPIVKGTPKLCTSCPHHMTTSIQRDNLIRIAINHSHIAETHPIKAIGKISLDIVNQISRRLEDV